MEVIVCCMPSPMLGAGKSKNRAGGKQMVSQKLVSL